VTDYDPPDPHVARLLDDPAVWAEVPADLRERTLAAAIGAVNDAGAGRGEATGGDPAPERPDVVPLRRAGGHLARRPRHRGRVLLVAAAVVVLGLVAAGALQLRGGDAGGTDVALAGTDGAPGATATARLRDEPAGVSVTFEVHGLPPAPHGTFYEVWLVGPTGKVSAGSFHRRGHQDQVKLWLGVDPAGYDAITVTRQPVDGGTLAKGEVMLRGKLPAGR
jgi:Anti-sigma-K factor rskA